MQRERSFTGNVPIILASQMKWEVLKAHFWGKFAKFNAPKKQVIIRPGNDPKPIQSPIVMQHELKRKAGDELKIPMLRNLTSLPKIGREQLENYEEDQYINHATVPLDILRNAVIPQEYSMDTQITKDYKLLQNAKPQLLRNYAEAEEFLGCGYALYYGYSYNILESSRFSGDSRITAVSHPHVFVVGNGKVDYTAGYPGTADYETALGTAINNLTDANTMSTAVLDALRASETVQKIDPLIMHDGNPMWLLVLHPYQLKDLESDDTFLKLTSRAYTQDYIKNNPYLVGCKHIYGGFAIFTSDTAVWPVTVSGGDPVWGPSTISNFSSFKSYSSDTAFAAILLGNNALFKAVGSGMTFKKRMADYDEIKAIAYRILEGYSRADYWNEDDGTAGQYLQNNGSALIVSYAAKPSM